MKTYLGDGVYIDVDQFGSVILTTSNGLSETNRIVLEPEVLNNLQVWIRLATARSK